jgi:hypothetical protein
MRIALRNAVVLFAVIACGCKEEDDDDPDQTVWDSSVLPGFEAGVDASRPDGGALEAGAIDANIPVDSSVPQVDTGTAMQDATAPADAAPGDASSGDASIDGGVGEAGASDGGSDASPSDAGGDARAGDAGGNGGPRDAGRDGAADASADARVDAGTPATFSRVLTILRSNCGTCHTTRAEAQLNFNLSAADVHADLIGVRASNLGECNGDPERIRVVPDDPEGSLLIQKLVDPACGDRMPRFRDPLTPALIDEIRSWIADGAPEN